MGAIATKKILSLLSLLVLLLGLGGWPTFASAEKNLHVSKEEAIGAALYHVVMDEKLNEESQWENNVRVVSIDDVYDSTGEQVSYLINLESDNQAKGFVEVAISKSVSPIQSYSYVSDQSQLQSGLKSMLIGNKNVISQKKFRLGPARFALKTDYMDGSADLYNGNEHYLLSKEENEKKPS